MSGLRTYRNFSLKDTPSLASKVAVVTGGSDGIGREIVAQLLLHDISKVYVLARKVEKFDKASIYWSSKGIDVEQRVEFVPCDLNDMRIVKKVGDELMGRLDRLDILINNAGLPPVRNNTLSPQGIEPIWSTNVVGPFILTNILLPKLESTATEYGNARIVMASSSLHMLCQELKFESLLEEKSEKHPQALDALWRYGRSKLGNILFTSELAKRLDKRGSDGVFANSFFPGNVPTEAVDTWKDLLGSIPGGVFKSIVQMVGQSSEDASATAIYLAASTEVESKGQRGKYFIPIATEDKTSKTAEDKDLAKNLWYWCDGQATKALGRGWDQNSVGIEENNSG
ncbi:oxidoreductase [Hyphodiscus hymeniophilus]|uniref:Oxidoreductase n=1 Tax=Hyphodiscus hymeniophilus TaxID=353542 RepID=A0A9P7AVD4_9HELO|nr:oxidoreductase [Hyphodiscus hymeniophilus]